MLRSELSSLELKGIQANSTSNSVSLMLDKPDCPMGSLHCLAMDRFWLYRRNHVASILHVVSMCTDIGTSFHTL